MRVLATLVLLSCSPYLNDSPDADLVPDAAPDAPPHVDDIACPLGRSPEICDGLDNDCDGQIDEPGDTTVQCFDGPQELAGVGECHWGLSGCVRGHMTPCGWQGSPRDELGLLACDGLDNDCDGVTDPGAGVDVTLFIDTSGSMEFYLEDIKAAVAANMPQSSDGLRYGLVEISRPGDAPAYFAPRLAQSGAVEFLAALEQLQDSDGGFEPTWDAITAAARGTLDQAMGYRPGARRLYFVFGDETAQSRIGLDQAVMCDAVRARRDRLVAFTLDEFFQDYAQCARAETLGGEDMATVIADEFATFCTP